MTGLGKTSRATIPAEKPAAPTPTEIDAEVTEKERAKRKARLARAGRQGTILTQGQPLGEPTQVGTTLLGGNT